MILPTNGGYTLFTRDGSRVLGRHSTYEQALAQERAIHVHKHAYGGVREDDQLGNGVKIAAVAGVLGVTGLIAWWAFSSQKSEVSTAKTASGPALAALAASLTPAQKAAVKAARARGVSPLAALQSVGITPAQLAAASKHASGPPPAIGILPGLWNVLLPWQQAAAVKYKATHPNFGSDYQEMIRVLAITPDQIKKANAQYVPFAGADVAQAAQAAAAPLDPSLQGTPGATPLVQDPDVIV